MDRESVEVWPALGAGGQTELKANLLLRLEREEAETVRKRLADVVAEVARSTLDENVTWPEALQFLHKALSEPAPHLKIVALTIIE